MRRSHLLSADGAGPPDGSAFEEAAETLRELPDDLCAGARAARLLAKLAEASRWFPSPSRADRHGNFGTVCAGSSLLACLLE